MEFWGHCVIDVATLILSTEAAVASELNLALKQINRGLFYFVAEAEIEMNDDLIFKFTMFTLIIGNISYTSYKVFIKRKYRTFFYELNEYSTKHEILGFSISIFCLNVGMLFILYHILNM
jgi:hypothetical protein